MQSSIIDDILSVEDRASAIVDDAEKEARNIIFEAEAKAKELVKTEVDRVKAESEVLIKNEQELLDENLRSYEEKKAELENSQVRIDEESLERASERIVQLLLTSGV